MGFKTQSVFTATYTNTTFTITESMGISSVSVVLLSGSATILGGLQFPGLTPSTVPLTVTQSVTFTANQGYTLEGITVDSTAGGVFEMYVVYDYNNAIDPSALAFITATGMTGTTQINAIDTLVKSLKATNLWSSMKAVYPFVTDNVNLLSYTQDFSFATFWKPMQTSVTANATIAPDGTLTADALFETSANNFHGFETTSSYSLTNGSIYTQSIYVKPIGRRYIALTTQWAGGATVGAWFDVQTATVFSADLTITASITLVDNGFYRIAITKTANSTLGYTNIWFDDSTPTSGVYFSGNTYIGDITKGFYIWGAQLELGSTASTYQLILTTQQSYISNQFKYNLVNPVDSDIAFRLVFNGGWTFSSNGATPNGTNGYANTFVNPSTNLQQNSVHLSYYSRTNVNLDQVEIGNYNNSSYGLYLLYTYGSGTQGWKSLNNLEVNVGTLFTPTTGLLIGSRTSSTSLKYYKQGILTDTLSATSLTPINRNITLAAQNGTGPANYSSKQVAFSTIGDGLTDAQASNFYNIVQTFQTALSRQI
jgi:hypothetical protein